MWDIILDFLCCSRRIGTNSRQRQRQSFTRAPPTIFHDNFSNLAEVSDALAAAGLESSNLLVAIDFTKSNEWTGRASHGGSSLHAYSPNGSPPPYATALSVVSRTLARFDDDGLIGFRVCTHCGHLPLLFFIRRNIL